MKKIYTGIDIGSDSIKILVVEYINDKAYVLASDKVQSAGVKNGVVVDALLLIDTLKVLISKTENKIGTSIKKVIAIVPPNNAIFKNTVGKTSIINESKKITGKDIIRAQHACIYENIDEKFEFVSLDSYEFLVDDEIITDDPKNHEGNILASKAVVLSTPKKNVDSIISTFNSIGIEVIDINIGGIGDYKTFKNEKTDKSTTLVMNIGHNKTDLTLYKYGIAVNNDVVNAGGASVDNDIMYMYNVSKETARDLKYNFIYAHENYASVNENKKVKNSKGEEININQQQITQVVFETLKEIINISKNRGNLLTNQEINYIIITGGITNLLGFKALCKECVSNFICEDIKLLGIRDNSYSSIAGVLDTFYDKLCLRDKDYSTFDFKNQEEIVNVYVKNNSNNNFLSKVFNYFFDN